MSKTLAYDHGRSIVEQIEKDCDAGTPWGIDDDGDALSAYDYVSEALDFTIMLDSKMRYKSAELVIGAGGPHVTIDTARGKLEVTWDTVYRTDLPEVFHVGLDEVISEMYEWNRP